MTNENTENTAPAGNEGSQLSAEGKAHLGGARKWINFLCILAFIGLGLMIILGLGFGTLISFLPTEAEDIPLSGSMVGLVYIVFAVVYLFPVIYLFQFAQRSKRYLRSNEGLELDEALRFMKIAYRYIGVLAIIMLSIYAVLIASLAIIGSSGLT